MSGKARFARRTVLLGTALLAGSLARPRPPVASDEVTHRAVEAFLSRLPAYPTASALEAAESALPASLLASMRARAEAASVAFHDYLAFCVMEALPIPAGALAAYVPRLLLFAVLKREGQSGLVGAAWLPLESGVEWQQSGSTAGLAFGGRPGWAVAAGNGLVAAVASGPGAEYLGAGVPPLLANQHCLRQGRSGTGVLASLTGLTACRAARHLVYDAVEGELSLAVSGKTWQVSSPTAPATVVAPPAEDATAGEESLRGGLEANHGWLDVAKALGLLQRAAPGADCLVLDAEAGSGTMIVGGAGQEVAF